jgi:hypothetical protein
MRRKGMLAALAASPQGRRLIQRAKDYANSPEGRRKLAEVRGRVTRRRSSQPPYPPSTPGG